MLSVILVTPVYAESGSEAGVFTRALSSFLTHSDHRVTVICSHAASAQPSHAEAGRLTIQRLAAKRNNRQCSFAALALSRVHELTRTDRCDTIISIDADPFSILATSTLGKDHAFLDIQTENLEPDFLPPLTKDAWQPPCFNRHVLLGIAYSEASRERLIDAYQLSRGPALGWSLALPDPNGDWRIVSSAESPRSGNDAILVSMRPGLSVLPELASAHGIPTVAFDVHCGDVQELAGSVNAAMEIGADRRRAGALEQWTRTDAIPPIDARVRHWNQFMTDASSRVSGGHLDSWLRLERGGIAACAAGGAA